ncbi:MAG: hypothetical protein IJ329_01535 [Clostridia bacterium]|nr:hypothetical protein [Clostridia bacterium]
MDCKKCGTSCVEGAVYVRGLLGYTQKKAEGWAVATMLSYLVGAAAFIGLHNVSLQSGMEMSKVIAPSGATKAGICFCVIFLGGHFLCRFIADVCDKKKHLFTKGFVLKATFAVIGAGFAAVVFAVVKNAGFTLKVLESNALMETVMSFPASNVEITTIFGVLGGEISNYSKISETVYMACTWNTVAEAALLATLVSAAFALGANLRLISGKKSVGAMIASATCLAFSVLLLVASVSSWGQVETAFGYLETTNVDSNFAKEICAVVFSAFLLTVSIVTAFIKKRALPQEKNEI